jgi:hypothetical protein
MISTRTDIMLCNAIRRAQGENVVPASGGDFRQRVCMLLTFDFAGAASRMGANDV